MRGKKLIWRVLSLCIGLSVVLIATMFVVAQGDEVEADEVVTLSPSQLVEKVLEADESSTAAELALEIARIEYEMNVAMHVVDGSSHALRTAELNWLKAQGNHRSDRSDLIIGVVGQIMDLDRWQLSLEIDGLQLDLARRNYARVEQQWRADIAGDTDLLEAELALAEAELAFDATVAQAERAKRNLTRKLGLEHFQVSPGLQYHEVDLPLSETLETVLADHLDIEDNEHKLFLAEMEVDRLKMEGAAALEIRVAELEAQLARFQLDTVESRIADQVEVVVENIDNVTLQYEIARKRVDNQRDRYERIKRQVDAGYILEDNLMTAEIALKQSERALLDALKDYIAGYLEYEKLVGSNLMDTVFLRGGF